MADYDLAIIGGGLNGVSVARDAAGRGLRVILLEQGDLGAAASSASPRLIHGDLSLLERRAFFRVRAALAERDIWLRTAPHLVRPMRFVIPAHSDERPSWLLRSGLLLYDRLAPRSELPASATVDVTHHPVGNALKRPFGTAFEYSDCVVDDSRLVVLNAVDAAERGAVIRTRTRLVRAHRAGDIWQLALNARGHREDVTARALVNAAVTALRAIYKPGYRYLKAGVMLVELQSGKAEQTSLHLFDEAEEVQPDGRPDLMATLDALNERFGRDAVGIASAARGSARSRHASRQERRSPRYTTRLDEIMVARA